MGFPHFIDRQKPGMIAGGRRFVNEADSYHLFTPAMITACQDDPDVRAFLIFDHRAVRRYGLGVAPPAPGRLEPHIANGYLRRGTTLRELAVALGVDPEGLQRTVERFNSFASRGEDPVPAIWDCLRLQQDASEIWNCWVSIRL